VPRLDEQPDELASLVRPNASRDPDENLRHAEILPKPVRAGSRAPPGCSRTDRRSGGRRLTTKGTRAERRACRSWIAQSAKHFARRARAKFEGAPQGPFDSPSRCRFRPPHRLTFALRLLPSGEASTYSRSVLGAGGTVLAGRPVRKGPGKGPRRILRSFLCSTFPQRFVQPVEKRKAFSTATATPTANPQLIAARRCGQRLRYVLTSAAHGICVSGST
jgi:hypothetical protein